MKTLGLLGGLSWRSTVEYYRLLNEGARERLGGQHSAKLLLYSFDFQEMTDLKKKSKWEALQKKMVTAAELLEQAGAKALVICSNTMHRTAEHIRQAVSVPIVDIFDATGRSLAMAGCRRPILLSTSYTVEAGLLARRMHEHHDIDVVLPDERALIQIDHIIYAELCNGVINPNSRDYLIGECEKLFSDGADSVIMGCTELTLILSEINLSKPAFDTTKVHANAALDYALS